MNWSISKKVDRQNQHQNQNQQITTRPFIRLTFFSTGGNVYYWDSKDQCLRRCFFTNGVRKMIYPRIGCAFGVDGVFFITADGLMYKGRFKESSAIAEGMEKASVAKPSTSTTDKKSIDKKSQKTDLSGDKTWKKASSTKPAAVEEAGDYFAFRKTGTFLETSECQVVSLAWPIQHVHRAISVSSASDGRNFCVIQQNPKTDLTQLPYKPPGTMMEDYGSLLQETDVNDFVHDIQIRTTENGAPFRATHKFILCKLCLKMGT